MHKIIDSKIVTLVVCAAFLQACASSSKNVSADYVSPAGYQALECDALVAERETLKTRIVEVSKAQDSKAGGDAAAVAVAAIVFLPAALFLAAGEDRSGELGRLKGEFDAVTTVATQKDCIPAEQLAEEKAQADAAVAEVEAHKEARRQVVSAGD